MPASPFVRTGQVIFALLAAGGFTMGAITLSGSLTPDTANTYTVGTTAAPFLSGAITSLTFTNASGTNVSASGSVSTTQLKVSNTGTVLDGIWRAAATIDANSISAGQSTSSAVTVTGASIGDQVLLSRTGDWSSPSSTVVIAGSVNSANTVTLYFQNTTTTSVDLTSSSYLVTVLSY